MIMKRLILLSLSLRYSTHAFIVSPGKALSSQRVNPCFVGYDFETKDDASDVDDDSTTVNKPRVEFAAISPGNQVEVQVGNVDLARKAWKKRRRTGSPLLIPCSILNTDRRSMVTNNLIYLLQKFGKPISEQKNMLERPFGSKSKDISLSMPDLHWYYKSKMRSPLHKHVAALGYESSADLLEDVFNEEVAREHGIKFYSTDDNLQWLVSSMSQMRGQRLSSHWTILQFLKNDDDNIMKHTGMMRTVRADSERKSYEMNALSAALRVSQRAIDSGVISNGSRYQSLVVALDPKGDGGSPLLKVSLNTPGEKKKTKTKGREIMPESKFELEKMEHDFHELKVGDGPFVGRVIRLNKKSDVAYIDIGVGRSAKGDKNNKKGIVRELGLLHFNDFTMEDKQRLEKWKENTVKKERLNVKKEMLNLIKYDDDDEKDIDMEIEENDTDLSNLNVDDLFAEEDSTSSPDEEVEEDITDLVTMEDGVFTLHDPDSGSNEILGSLDDDEDSDINDGTSDDDLFNGLTPDQRFEKLEEIYSNDASYTKDIYNDESSTKNDDFVNEGDEVEVYIQAVSKQSGKFTVTKNSAVPVLKEVKKEAKANKNLERLLARFDGDIKNILKWKGTVGEGTVKATSKTGDWLYVEPHFHDLPVGVAQLDDNISIESLSQGDSVKVRLDGIDSTRGQLSLTIVDKT